MIKRHELDISDAERRKAERDLLIETLAGAGALALTILIWWVLI